MASDLEVDGQLEFPDEGFTLKYTVDQQNLDPWNTVVDFNWDINKKLSWMLEYNGFNGSRESVTTGLAIRY